jgi:hypothetical protein
MDLLTAYTHHSELQVITALSLISTFYASNGIRTHDPSVRAGEDGSCLRPIGHCDR